jgi:hypothetical protein
MSHNFGTGYKGHRSWASQPCATSFEPEKSKMGKFRNVGHGVVYSKPMALEDNGFGTINQATNSVLRKECYKKPDRRGVAAEFDKRDNKRAQKKFIATTTNTSNFPNFLEEAFKVTSLSEEDIRPLFDRLDADSSGYIDLGETTALLTEVMGEVPSQRVIDRFMKFFDTNSDGRVSWHEFSTGLSKVKELAMQDVSTGSGRMVQPEWAKSVKEEKRVIKKMNWKSSYGLDLGTGEDPKSRGYTSKTGMKSTTDDLNCGTSKEAYHIPGYGGFIPASSNNPGKIGQGQGKSTSGKANDLRLFHKHNIPGYTGHCPVDEKNRRGECVSGTDPRTTTGAASLGL